MRGSVWAARASIHTLVRPRALRDYMRVQETRCHTRVWLGSGRIPRGCLVFFMPLNHSANGEQVKMRRMRLQRPEVL